MFPIGIEAPPNVVLYREAGLEASLVPRYEVLVASLPSWLVCRATVGNKVVERWPWLLGPGRQIGAKLVVVDGRTLHPNLILFAGTSIGGFIVIATMFLSYLQWYLVALLLPRLVGGRNPAMAQAAPSRR
jgi:hypothetical protein